jgi:TolB protein
MNALLRRIWQSAGLLVLLGMLSACGSANDAPAPQQAQNDPAQQTEAQSQGDTQVSSTGLPGRLLFVQQGTIWLWQGKEASPLIEQGESVQPAWSPDGTRIAYVQRGESYSNIVIADANGRPLATLTTNESDFPPHSHERIYDSMWALYPTWSPDGNRIAMASQHAPPTGSPAFEYNLALYTLPTTGGRRVQVYADNSSHFGHMSYMPDGSILVYTNSSSVKDGLQQLHRLSLAREESTPFPGAPLRSYDPAFSPDGRWLAFAARIDDQTDIWLLPGNPGSSSTPQPRRLTTLGTARAPVFSPDGTRLAFLAIPPGGQGFELWSAEIGYTSSGSLQMGEPQQLTAGMRLDADSGLSWAR